MWLCTGADRTAHSTSEQHPTWIDLCPRYDLSGPKVVLRFSTGKRWFRSHRMLKQVSTLLAWESCQTNLQLRASSRRADIANTAKGYIRCQKNDMVFPLERRMQTSGMETAYDGYVRLGNSVTKALRIIGPCCKNNILNPMNHRCAWGKRFGRNRLTFSAESNFI